MLDFGYMQRQLRNIFGQRSTLSQRLVNKNSNNAHKKTIKVIKNALMDIIWFSLIVFVLNIYFFCRTFFFLIVFFRLSQPAFDHATSSFGLLCCGSMSSTSIRFAALCWQHFQLCSAWRFNLNWAVRAQVTLLILLSCCVFSHRDGRWMILMCGWWWG